MQRAVCLASGGLDSSTCLYLLMKMGVTPIPVFVNYGQLNAEREFTALKRVAEHLALQEPVNFDFRSFGKNIPSGITDPNLDIVADAFTPMRNMLFLVCAAAIAKDRGATVLVMGLLHESTVLFPDQTDKFIAATEEAINSALNYPVKVLLPLRDYTKSDVVRLSQQLGVISSYSCHAGGADPCGNCISCNEYKD